MITINDVNEELKKLYDPNIAYNQNIKKGKQRKEFQKRAVFLKNIKLYLERSPTSSFIKSEIERIENRIELLMNQFFAIHIAYNPSMSPLRRKYEKENDIPKLKMQLKTLRFILKR